MMSEYSKKLLWEELNNRAEPSLTFRPPLFRYQAISPKACELEAFAVHLDYDDKPDARISLEPPNIIVIQDLRQLLPAEMTRVVQAIAEDFYYTNPDNPTITKLYDFVTEFSLQYSDISPEDLETIWENVFEKVDLESPVFKHYDPTNQFDPNQIPRPGDLPTYQKCLDILEPLHPQIDWSQARMGFNSKGLLNLRNLRDLTMPELTALICFLNRDLLHEHLEKGIIQGWHNLNIAYPKKYGVNHPEFERLFYYQPEIQNKCRNTPKPY